MTNKIAIKTSPCPLQRGIGAYCPPLEGAGGGKKAWVVIGRNEAIRST